MRDQIVKWLKKNNSKPMDDGSLGEATTLMTAAGCTSTRGWKAYCNKMAMAGKTWGDQVTLVAACAVFNAEISVISSLRDDCIQTIQCPAFWGIAVERTLVIAHYAEYHYASVQEKQYSDVVEGNISTTKSDVNPPDDYRRLPDGACPEE